MQNKNPKKKLGIYTLNIGVIRKLVKNGGPGIAQIPVFGEGTVYYCKRLLSNDLQYKTFRRIQHLRPALGPATLRGPAPPGGRRR